MYEELRKHKHIVFGAEHYNPLGIVRSLGESGISPIGIILQSDRPVTSKSKYMKTKHFVNNVEEGYELLLSIYGNEKYKPFIYTSDDQVTNYLDDKYEDICNKFFFFNAGEKGRVAVFQNKDTILKIANKHGLNVLKTYTVKKGEIPDDIEYPIITKAIISTLDHWKGDMFICNNEEELKEAYKKIRSEKVLLQKYIIKKNELCLEGVSVNRGKESVVTIASTYNYINAETYSHYMTVNNLNDINLENKLKGIIEEIGFEGIFEVEFLVGANNDLYFLEINFRNSTWSYASTIAGMNLPISWALGMINPEKIHDVYKKIPEPFMGIVEFDDYRHRVCEQHMGRLKWLKDYKNSRCKYYTGRNDIMPLLSVIKCKIWKDLIKKEG